MIFIKKQNYILPFALLTLLSSLSISMVKNDSEEDSSANISGFKYPDAKLHIGQSLVNICCHCIIDNNIQVGPYSVNIDMQERLAIIQQIKNTQMPKALEYALLNIIDDCSFNLISKALRFINRINNHFDNQEANFILTACLAFGKYSFVINPWAYLSTGFINMSSLPLSSHSCVNKSQWLIIKDEIEELKRLCLTLSDSAQDEDLLLGHELNFWLLSLGKSISQDFIAKIINNGNENSFEYKVALAYEMISKRCFDLEFVMKVKAAAADQNMLTTLSVILSSNKGFIECFEERELEDILKYHENALICNKNNFIDIKRYIDIVNLYFLIGKDDKVNNILNSIIDQMKSSDNDALSLVYSVFIRFTLNYISYRKISNDNKDFMIQNYRDLADILKSISNKLRPVDN